MGYDNYWALDPELTEAMVRGWLNAGRETLRCSEYASNKYECDHGGPKCKLAYLPYPDMERPYMDEVIPRNYPHGAVICLEHSTMWPHDPDKPLPENTPHVWEEMARLGEIESGTKLKNRVPGVSDG